MRFSDILLEYNRDATVKNYGEKILAVAMKDNTVPWLDILGDGETEVRKVKELLRTPEGQQASLTYIMGVIEQSDPTKNKNYAQAITRLYSLGGTMLEDIGATLSQYLVKFDKLKNKKKIQPPYNDFMRYKTVGEFYDVVDKLPNPDSEVEQQKIGEIQLPPENSWRYVYGSLDASGRITSDFVIIQPLNKYAGYWWAKEYPKKGVTNRWCTAWEGENSRFDYYAKQGPLFIIIPAKRTDDNEKYQFHFETKQFMDFQDHQIGDEGIDKLTQRFPNLTNALLPQAIKFNILPLMPKEFKDAIRSHSRPASEELKNLIVQYKDRISMFGFSSLSDYGITVPKEVQQQLKPAIDTYLDEIIPVLTAKGGFWSQVVSKIGSERNEDRLEVFLNTDTALKNLVEQSEAGKAIAELARSPEIARKVDASHLQDLILRDPLFRFIMRQVPKLYVDFLNQLNKEYASQYSVTQNVAEAIPLDTLRSTAGTRVKDEVSAKLKQNGPLGRDAEKAKQNGKPVKPGVAEGSKSECPPATQDIKLNLKNRQKAIDDYGYGPLNPDLPNRKFWMAKVEEWNLDSTDEAKSSLCGNCAAFDQREATLDCIAQGIGSDTGADDPTIDAGDLGYCRFLKFKCASRRTCDAWVTGGPLTDKQDVAEGFNSKQEMIDHFVRQGKTAAQGAAAWERTQGQTGKKKPNPFDPNYKFKTVDNKRYGEKDIDEGIFGSKPAAPEANFEFYLDGCDDAHRVKKYLLNKFGSQGWQVFAAGAGTGKIFVTMTPGLYPTDNEAKWDIEANCGQPVSEDDWHGAADDWHGAGNDPADAWHTPDGAGAMVSEDWQKANKRDKTDGMSQKAVNSYRRENPGSKLKTAVTTKPSKLKPGSKAAKRRKSFCARMGGNKGPMKKPNGKPTPKALALRRWNCESAEDVKDLLMIAESIRRGIK
jgi:hypothetical protein